MDRRAYLGSVLAGVGGIAGCTGGSPGTDRSPTPSRASPTPTATPRQSEVELPLDESALTAVLRKDAIPAITQPSFAPDWGEVSGLRLDPSDEVIGVERDGRARAYPLRILDWHEVVNDDFGGPLLVTFCPLCGSGVTAERRVDGQETAFGVSGYLWRSDLVMYDDRTDSLWSQLLGKAVRGPRAGEALTLVPSQRTRLRNWRESHPDTEVLLPPPASETVTGDTARYDQRGYQGYDESGRIGVGQNDFDDHRLHPKTEVVGVTVDGEAVAYPLPVVESAGVVNDSVGGEPVVVAAMPGGALAAYVRTVETSVLTFERADEQHLAAGGSTWAIQTGRAVDGSHEGTVLEQANDRSQLFWFAWADFYPHTAVYGNDG